MRAASVSQVLGIFYYLQPPAVKKTEKNSPVKIIEANPKSEAINILKNEIPRMQDGPAKIVLALIQLVKLRIAYFQDLSLKPSYWGDNEEGPVERLLKTLKDDLASLGFLARGHVLSITDEALENIVSECASFFQGDQEALKNLDTCKKAIKRNDLPSLLESLELIQKENLSSVNLRNIMERYQQATTQAKLIRDETVITFFGGTGVGKSTLIHLLVGSKFKSFDALSGKIEIADWPSIAADIHAGSSVNSLTKDLKVIDLSKIDPKWIRYVLPGKVLLCDLPGFEDTAGCEATIINALCIVDTLQAAAKVHPLVLLSAKDFDTEGRGQHLLKILGNVAKLIENSQGNYQHITYAFRGGFPDVLKAQGKGLIEELLKDSKGLSENLRAILVDLKSKLDDKLLCLHPGKPGSPTPHEIVGRILGAGAISNPKAFSAYVEGTQLKPLKLQVTNHYVRVKQLISQLSENNSNLALTLRELREKLEELDFIHDKLGHYLTDFDGQRAETRESIIRFFKQEQTRVFGLFATTSLGTPLLPEDLERYKRWQYIKKYVALILEGVYRFRDQDFSQFLDEEKRAQVGEVFATTLEEIRSGLVRIALVNSCDLKTEPKLIFKAIRAKRKSKVLKPEQETILKVLETKLGLTNILDLDDENILKTQEAKLPSTVVSDLEEEALAKTREAKLGLRILLSEQELHTYAEALLGKIDRFMVEETSTAALRTLVGNLSQIEKSLGNVVRYEPLLDISFQEYLNKKLGMMFSTLKVSYDSQLQKGSFRQDGGSSTFKIISDSPLQKENFKKAILTLDRIATVADLQREYLSEEPSALLEVKSQFITALDEAVSARTGGEALTEAATQALSEIVELMTELRTLREAQHLKGIEINGRGLREIYLGLKNWANTPFSKKQAEINELIETNSLESIRKIQAPFQQLNYLIRLPSLITPENNSEFTNLVQKVKEFTLSFFGKYKTLLELDAEVGLQQYQEIERCIGVLSETHAGPLAEKLKACIHTRTMKSANFVSTAKLSFLNPQILSTLKPKLSEIHSLLSTLSTHLEAESVTKLESAARGYVSQVESLLQQIIETALENVRLEDLISYATFVRACEANCEAKNLPAAKEHLQKLTVAFAASKIEGVRVGLERVSPSENAEQLNPEAVAECVGQVQTAFAELARLQKELPEYSEAVEAPEEKCRALISENIALFGDQLAKAMSSVIAGGPAGPFQETLMLCEQLFPLDNHLIFKADSSVMTYHLLHSGYQRTFSSEFRGIVDGVMRAVEIGDYPKAVKAAEELPSEVSVLGIFCTQTSNIMARKAKALKRLLTTIAQSKDFSEKTLDEMIPLYAQLARHTVLADAGLLNENTQKLIQAALDSKSNAIDAWFENCCETIRKAINTFNIRAVMDSFYDLKTRLGNISPAHQHPNDVQKKIQGLEKEFDIKLRATLHSFSKPFSEWEKNQHNLFTVCDYLLEVQNQSWQEKSFGEYWLELARSVYARVESACEHLEAQIESSSFSVDQIIQEINTIQTSTLILSQEAFELPRKVLAKLEAVIQKLKARLLELADEDIVTYVQNVKTILIANESLPYLRPQDITEFHAPVQEICLQIQASLAEALKNHEFPEESISLILDLNQHTGEHFPEITTAFRVAISTILDLVRHLLLEASILISRHKPNANLLNYLEQIRRMSFYRNIDKSNAFSSLLAKEHESEFLKILSEALNFLTSNRENLFNAYQTRDLAQMRMCLDNAKEWQETLEILVNIVGSYDPAARAPEMNQLLTHNRDYNYEALLKSLRTNIRADIERHSMDLSKFEALQEKDSKSRGSYFEGLAGLVKFIRGCQTIPEHALEQDLLFEVRASTQAYLQRIYERALHEFPEKLEDKESWETLNLYCRELQAFSKSCKGDETLNHIELNKVVTFTAQSTGSYINPINLLNRAYQSVMNSNNDETVLAINASAIIINCFKALMKKCLDEQAAKIAQCSSYDEKQKEEFRKAVIEFALSLQKIINTLPILTKQAFDALADFFSSIRKALGPQYLQMLSDDFQEIGSDLSMAIIGQQKCFKGVSIALRNLRTKEQGIDYVVRNMRERRGLNEIHSISWPEQDRLTNLYQLFKGKYEAHLTEYLDPTLDWKEKADDPLSPATSLPQEKSKLTKLREQLQNLLKQRPVQFDENNKMIWDERVTDKIIDILAIFFAIWTLRHSKAHFEAGAKGDDMDYLQRPHPTQMTAIFRLLNMTGHSKGLPNQLAQVLTGEGKSVTLAGISAVLALLGGTVKHSCYSEYLSSRDWNDFESIFKFLGIDQHIVYGTYDLHNEATLNKDGDIREKMRSLMTGEPLRDAGIGKAEKAEKERPVFMLGDEIDVFSSVFFSQTFNPYARLDTEEVVKLIQLIWTRHAAKTSTSFDIIKKSKEYKDCLARYKGWESMLEHSVKNMITALGAYRKEHGHDYDIQEGHIAYQEQDGYSITTWKGYRTLWAYFYEHAQGKINTDILKEYIGATVNCGNYLYSSLLRDLSNAQCILGVTGTLEELSLPERQMLHSQFNFGLQTFVPTAYAKPKPKFRKKDGVTICPDKESYFDALLKEILQKQSGTTNQQAIRPVIVFFETKERLEEFYNSKALKKYHENVAKITNNSKTTTAEKQEEILKATSKGKITLAVREAGRGRDFTLLDQAILTNGGMHCLTSFMPEELSEEAQIFGRVGRQGQDGSASMILLAEDLNRTFGVTQAQISQMIDENSEYDTLHKLREEKFARNYEARLAEIKEVEKALHQPSMQLWKKLCEFKKGDDSKELVTLIHKFNLETAEEAPQAAAAQVAMKRSSTLILMDATGSMKDLIEGVKSVITDVMQGLIDTLKGEPGAQFEVQLAVYRNYNAPAPGEGSSPIFDSSDWAKDPKKLQEWIKEITPDYGMGNEAVEVGLCHAYQESEKKELTQVILIGDCPPNTQGEINFKRYERGDAEDEGHFVQFYKEFRHSDEYVSLLAQKGIPIHAFFVAAYARESFTQMANATKGESGYLDVNARTREEKEAAARNLHTLFGKTVLTQVAGKDAKKLDTLMQKYSQSFKGSRR